MPQPLPLDRLDPFDTDTGDLTVVIETPKGSRNKYGHDPRTNGFKLNHILPAGPHFPFDFGFVPSTAVRRGVWSRKRWRVARRTGRVDELSRGSWDEEPKRCAASAG